MILRELIEQALEASKIVGMDAPVTATGGIQIESVTGSCGRAFVNAEGLTDCRDELDQARADLSAKDSDLDDANEEVESLEREVDLLERAIRSFVSAYRNAATDSERGSAVEELEAKS